MEFLIELAKWGTLVVVFLAFYFVPPVIAYKRHLRHANAIFFYNLILGWSGIIWLVMLAWALLDRDTDE